MIDNLAIIFSTVAVLVTIYRAVKLDADRPWFKPWQEGDEVPPRGAQAQRPWRRR